MMKKRENHIKKWRCHLIRFYLEDFYKLMDFLKEHYTIADVEVNGIRHRKQVSVEVDGYEINDPSEIETLDHSVARRVYISINYHSLRIHFTNKFTIMEANFYDDDIKTQGILVQLEEIISKTASPFLFFASHAFRWGIVGFVFMFGLFYALKTIEGSKSLPILLTSIILPAVAISTLWLYIPSKFLFYLKSRKEKNGIVDYLDRNRYKIIFDIGLVIVGAVLGEIVKYLW